MTSDDTSNEKETLAEREIVIGVRDLDSSLASARDWASRMDRNVAGESPSELFFDTIEQMMAALTPNRWRIVSVVSRIGPISIRALAKKIDRDYSSVHADVTKLLDYELLARTPDKLIEVPWQKITAEIAVEKAA